MERWSVIAVVAVVAVVAMTVEGVLQLGSQDQCRSQHLCRDCIQTVGCVWCINPKTGENCQHPAFVNLTSFCEKKDLQDPENRLQIIQDEPLTGAGHQKQPGKAQPEQIIQLKPQRVKLYLRQGMPIHLNLTYRRARDYPVDLYYLMDLSNSMKDDKQTLANMGTLLAQTMTKLTSQFALGFGSFVDKVKMPFTNTTNLNEATPCEGCAFPYSFKNDMKLSQNHEEFTEKVRNAAISGNLDHPEGGFDALMQAMVCREEIGWRNVSRRIIVFSTDAKFHHAGDGRLGGIVTPNDERCHLSYQGEYTAFNEYDYPSIGQINKVAAENNIYIIFAVLNNFNLYQKLSESIKTSSFGELKNASTNVVDLIKDQYNNISSTVKLTDNSDSDITIKYSSACLGHQVNITQECGNIAENDTVVFQLEITANSCPKNGAKSILVKTPEDSVTLDIEFLCSCNCPESLDDSECNKAGSKVCGVCECFEGYYGRKCECDSHDYSYDLSDDSDQQAKCKANTTDTKPCSGRGKCVCGMCDCFSNDVSGDYCECNKQNCKARNGEECSGHGKCDCNSCSCNPGYFGPHCECEERTCIQPGSDQVCSGHGWCDCYRCRCRDDQHNMTYTGQYCEDCLSCDSDKCNKLKDCVKCEHFGLGPRKHDCSTCEPSQAVENLDDHMKENSRQCTFVDEEGCYVNFIYHYLEATKKDEVFVQEKRICPKAPPILKIVFALIGAIVGIGVLTLVLWKVYTSIHDRREYANFIKERDGTQFNADENPLYMSPSTTTKNPMFEQQTAN